MPFKDLVGSSLSLAQDGRETSAGPLGQGEGSGLPTSIYALLMLTGFRK